MRWAGFLTNTGSELVNVLFRSRTIKSTYTERSELCGIEVARVDSDSGAALGHYRFPVRHTAAGIAPHELQRRSAPGVCACGPGLSAYFDLVLPVVGPQRTVAAADRTVAICQRSGPTGNLDQDCPAMTSGFQHATIASRSA